MIARLEDLSAADEMTRYASDTVMYHLCMAIIKVFVGLSNTDPATKASFMPNSGRPSHQTVVNLLLIAVTGCLTKESLDGFTMRWERTQANYNDHVALTKSADIKRPHSPVGDTDKPAKVPRKTHANDSVPLENQLCSDHVAAMLGLSGGVFPKRTECPRKGLCRSIHLDGLENYSRSKILNVIDGSANKAFAKQIALRKLIVENMPAS
jgi:hypothetical protein